MKQAIYPTTQATTTAQPVGASAHEAGFESRWLAVLDALPDLLFELDLEGRYLDYHLPRSDLLAMPAEVFLGKTLHEVLSAAAAEESMAVLHEANVQGFSQGRRIQKTLPGSVRWFELSASRKDNGPGQPVSFIVLSRDVTERVVTERKLQRMTQLYAALSQCNQAIVRCKTEAELYPSICRDAVHFGGMKMAWIASIDTVRQQLVPVASAGEGTDYLHGLVVTLDATSPSGQGPSGGAVREGRPYWCQDFLHDPTTAVWHERASQYGWGSSAALPLHCNGKVVGLFTVYSGEPHAFDEAAQNLLLEMAMDISYALDRFADELSRQQVQTKLRESEERYRKAFETSPDAVNITRRSDGLYLDVNIGFERLTGWRREEVVGKTSLDLNLWADPIDRQRMVDALQKDGHCSNLEVDFVKKNGDIIHGLISAESVQFDNVDCLLTVTRDVTEKKRAEAQIERLAHFDQLTGLPNRSQIQERFQFALGLAHRKGECMAVMFLDLDHFKNINDTLGHSVGDLLLIEVARRMTGVLRAEDTLSRLGGDEFILMLPAIGVEGAQQVAKKLIEAVARPCQIEQYELVSTISIGIALYPQDGEDFETLSKNADTAMYRVKQDSRNSFCFFTQEMQAHSARSLHLVNAMHHALKRQEFSLHYQPQVSLQDGRIVGAEALLRWQHPELGALSPAEFIPIAEDSGQILAIGEWVLRTAVTQLRRWMDAGLNPMVVAVNVSAVQFRHPDLVTMVTQILDEVGLPPQYLELELTEATAMDDPQAAVEVMNQLHARGIRMSIDDFGTGYSSLSYLKKFKIYRLKIDQSFVRDIGEDPDDKAIVTAIINLASSMGMQTIAEGVETASQLAFLRLQGCTEVQGYYFSKPLPADRFEVFVREMPVKVRPAGVLATQLTRYSSLPEGLVALTATAHGLVGNTMVRAAQQAFGELMSAISLAGVLAQVGSFMSMLPDNAHAPDDPDCRYVAAVLFGYSLAGLSGACGKPDMRLSGTLAWQVIASGRYAVFTHIGPYDTLFQSWATIHSTWLPASGESLRRAPLLELMLNDPQTTPPELLRTEIWMPLM
ncbi:EAL domain-containing protein [Rhodoferax sp.]|uniref:EAL domain-containing protein n=1 Tax=Rhodoferax sp. TaxID=50421 RepID=UPI002850354A|nr:EAL domain-containing protein [Rhodoferax sp.]MDR3369627.1 EAL domain-containing protein [Rhodoferax sp.]